jgi:hypothetical protein
MGQIDTTVKRRDAQAMLLKLERDLELEMVLKETTSEGVAVVGVQSQYRLNAGNTKFLDPIPLDSELADVISLDILRKSTGFTVKGVLGMGKKISIVPRVHKIRKFEFPFCQCLLTTSLLVLTI